MPPSETPDASREQSNTTPISRPTLLNQPLERTTSLETSPRPNSSRSDNDAVLHPGTIRINLRGAFIVDEESPHGSATPSPNLPPQPEEDRFEYKHDTNDIRLPNQSAVVSHVAVDVCATTLHNDHLANAVEHLQAAIAALTRAFRSVAHSPSWFTSPQSPARKNWEGACISSNSRLQTE